MHDGGMNPARRPRAARGYSDAALTRALFKAQARRRSAFSTPPPSSTRHWPVMAAVLLVPALIVSLVILVAVIITQTRPLPATGGQAYLFVELPAQLTDPHTLISFTPVADPVYYTSVAFNATTLEVNTGQAFSSIGSNPDFSSAPVVNSNGRAVNTGSWIQPNTWKVLIQVTGTGTLPRLSLKPGDPGLLYVATINDNGSGLISHFLTETSPGCAGSNSTAWPLNNAQDNGQGVQVQWIYPCQGALGRCPSGVNTKQWCMVGEAILNYPVESEATGHVAGMLPIIDVGYAGGSDNIRTTPYHVIVAGDNFTPSGTVIPGLQDVSISPSTTSADSLSWQEDGSLQASWSWTVISDVDRAEQISNICLVLVGVASSALIAILGYLIKLLITSNRSARKLIRNLVLLPTAKLRARVWGSPAR